MLSTFLIIGSALSQTVYYAPGYYWWGYGIEYEYDGVILHILMHEPLPPEEPERIQYEILFLGLIFGMVLFGLYKAATKKWAIVEYDKNGVQKVRWVKKQPQTLRPNEEQSMIQVVTPHTDENGNQISTLPIIESLEKEVEHYKTLSEVNMKELLSDIIRKI